MANILIVESHDAFARSLAAQVESLGPSVVQSVSCTRSALDAVRIHRPDCVLITLEVTSSIDGIDVAGRIVEDSATAVIFVTTGVDNIDYERAASVRHAGFISKPVRLPDLEVALNLALARGRMSAGGGFETGASFGRRLGEATGSMRFERRMV